MPSPKRVNLGDDAHSFSLNPHFGIQEDAGEVELWQQELIAKI